jgi:cellulose synthase/poly-beta-1,6-N-acetylglucosamine synthase-like glycosyltransferase
MRTGLGSLPAPARPRWATAIRQPSHDPGLDLPPDIAFLRDVGVRLADLRHAQARSAHDARPASDCLLAYGGVSEVLFYRALASHLGLSFVQSGVGLAPDLSPADAIRRGLARLATAEGPRWLLAPNAKAIRLLLTARRVGLPMPALLITTPTRFSALVRRAASVTIEREAREALPDHDSSLSAKDAVDGKLAFALTCCALALLGSAVLMPMLSAALAGLLFSATISLRLLLCAAGLRPADSQPAPIADAALPFYSVLVPLYREADGVPALVARLDRLAYPRSKLQIKLLVEADDAETQSACFAARLAPHYEVIIVPQGRPRTKPRALNVALPLVKDGLVTVYDAEDIPDPDQLCRAAARFHAAHPDIACLQARLAIHNGAEGLLPRLFQLEYQALFNLFNPGVAACRLPMALGGTSNHFRTSVLRNVVGGWDAWNVAEDADLGIRLARWGFRTEVLDSTTYEEAPVDLGNWFRQRRRWTKGWMQTAIVLGRTPKRLHAELGSARTLAVLLMLTSLVAGPLAAVPLTVLMLVRLIMFGLPDSGSALDLAAATLWTWVLIAGPASTLWMSYAGMRTQGCRVPIRILIWMLPYQALIGIAAWGGLVDLCRSPYHWHKTRHGAAVSTTATAWTGLNKRTGRSRRRPSATDALGVQPLRAFRAAYLASRAALRATSSAMTREARASAAAASAALASSASRRSASRWAPKAASRAARSMSSVSRSLARIASRSAMRTLRASTIARRAVSRAFSSGLAIRA